MIRLLHILLALLSFFPATLWADDSGTVNVGEMKVGQRYYTQTYLEFKGVFHAPATGLYRVMSTTSDYPMPYRDAAYADFIDDIIVSFYDDGQGYVINLEAGQVIYLYRPFCMNISSAVWIERCASTLSYTAQPAEGERLVPSGIGQFIFSFPQPVVCDGGSITCADETYPLAPQGGSLALLYDIKEVVMGWIRKGFAPGTDITVTLNDVRAVADASIKAGNGGTLTVHYVLPDIPGEFVSDNFYRRTFKSYWPGRDEEGIFRMTFTRPVNVQNPGYINLIYGVAEANDIGVMTLQGEADGYDIVFDLRETFFRPADIIGTGSTSKYDSIRVCPGAIRDDNGDYMFSPGAGSLGSWNYTLPYKWYNRQVTAMWELTDLDENELSVLSPGDPLLFYIYMYDYIDFDGFRFDFADGTSEVVPLATADVELYPSSDYYDAEVTIPTPYVFGDHGDVTVSLNNMVLVNGSATPTTWHRTYGWDTILPTGISQVEPQPEGAVGGLYLINGHRATSHTPGIVIRPGRKEIVKRP